MTSTHSTILEIAKSIKYLSRRVRRIERQVTAVPSWKVLGYTEYVALVTQSGTNAPSSTEIKNDTGATAAWSYIDVGTYRLTFSSSVLTNNKTAVLFTPGGTLPCAISGNRGSSTIVAVYTRDNTANLTNGRMTGATMVVRIYV